MSKWTAQSLTGLGAALIASLFWVVPASGMTVTSTGEGGCSLRAAIQAVADNNSGTSCGSVVSGGPTPINLPANTYTPTNGQIVVPAGTNVEINGDNVNNPLTTVIDGAGGVVDRIFNVEAGASLKLSGLQVTGGRTADSPVSGTPNTIVPVEKGGAINNLGSLTLDHVVVSGNRTGNGSPGTPPLPEGGGGGGGNGGSGGGIYNSGGASLTITNSEIRDNLTGNGGNGAPGAEGVGGLGHNPDGKTGGNGSAAGDGGGVYNANNGSVTIDSSTISGNHTGTGGSGGQGGIGAGPSPAPGGGTFGAGDGGNGGDGGNSGRQYRKDQGIYWDEARGGGGIFSLGSMTITNSTISGNSTGAGGSGGTSGYGGNNMDGTFQSSGLAGSGGGGGRGGGLLIAGNPGNTTLINLTVTGNTTGAGGAGGQGILGDGGYGGRGGSGGDGGGIWALKGNSGSLSLSFGTIARNFVGVAGPGGGGKDGTAGPGDRGQGAGVTAGGRISPSGSTVYMSNSIVALNGNPALGDLNCVKRYAPPAYVDFGDQGNNLTFPGGSDCPGTVGDPLLGSLGDFGGPTKTILPGPGSPAIGGVPLASCSVPNDQRGQPRPGDDGTACDIGAVETGPGDMLTPTTTQVVSSAQPSKVGQQVTFTATVSPPPSSGTVEFKDGGATISGCAATALKQGGKFTCPVTYGSAGTHSIVASYSGNTLFRASTSAAFTQTVSSGTQPPPKTAKISKVKVTGPSSTRKGGRPSFTVKITNSGNAAASGVRLKLTGGGAHVTKTVGGIPAGSSKSVQIHVKLKKVGQKTLTFKATSANAGSASATKSVTVRPRRRHHPRHHH